MVLPDPIDIVQLYRQQLEEARREKQAVLARHFGVSDEASVERVTRRRRARAESEAALYEDQIRRKDEALESLGGALRGLWGDLEGMHVRGCSRMGLACPACEAQGRIEGVL